MGWGVLQRDLKAIFQAIGDLWWSCCEVLHFAVVNKVTRTLWSTEAHPHRTACETGAWAQTIAVLLASLKDLLVSRLRKPTLLLLHCHWSVSEKSINQICNTIIFPNWGLGSAINKSLTQYYINIMQPHFKMAVLRDLNDNKYFLEILLESCPFLGRKDWSWSWCYMLHQLTCLFVCFWLMAHLQLCEKWQNVNILPLMSHVTDAQHSRPGRGIWVLQTLLTARFTDGWRSSMVLTQMLLTSLPSMLDGLQLTAVHPGHKRQELSMLVAGDGLILKYGIQFRNSEISTDKCFGNVCDRQEQQILFLKREYIE